MFIKVSLILELWIKMLVVLLEVESFKWLYLSLVRFSNNFEIVFEISPKELYNNLGTIFQIGITLGIFLSISVGLPLNFG